MRMVTENRTTMLDDLLSRVCVELEITKGQREGAEASYNSVGRWLAGEGSPLAKLNPTIYAQGSLRLDTTVRPKGKNEFDLDLVCEFSGKPSNPNPIATLKLIEYRLKQHGTYASMIEPKKRCVRLNYTSQYHMDILPAYPDFTLHQGCLLVPDREALDWKESAPKIYADWFEKCCMHKLFLEKSAKIEPFPDYDLPKDKPSLKRMVQLMKRYRDIKYSQDQDKAPISIVITTLAGKTYDGEYSVSKGIGMILRSIELMIPSNDRLRVHNPSNLAEDFSEKWDKDPNLYKEFVNWVKVFNVEWNRLQALQDNIQLSDELKRMFGEEIAVPAMEKHAAYVEQLRKSGLLGVSKNSVMLTEVAATTTTGAITRRTTVPQNTFYGK